MLRTVQPHDIVAACEQCNMTLAMLSEETGIVETELLDFAAGRIPLSAQARFLIIATLVSHVVAKHGVPDDCDARLDGVALLGVIIRLQSEAMFEDGCFEKY